MNICISYIYDIERTWMIKTDVITKTKLILIKRCLESQYCIYREI